MNTSQRSCIRDGDLEGTTGVRPCLQIACWAILGYSHSEWFVSELSDLPLCIFTSRKAVQKCSFPLFSFTANSKTLIHFSYSCNLHNKFLIRSILGHHLPKLNLRMRRHCTLDRGEMKHCKEWIWTIVLESLYEHIAIGIRDSFKPKVSANLCRHTFLHFFFYIFPHQHTT